MRTMKSLIKYLAIIAILSVLPFLLRSPFLTHVGVMICLYTALALSMNLMLRIGQISFAHGAFMGLGAYGSALMMMRLGLPFPVALLATALGVTLLAWLVGLVFLRIRGVYFVLLTFAFGEIIVLTFIEWVSLFGGSGGLAVSGGDGASVTGNVKVSGTLSGDGDITASGKSLVRHIHPAPGGTTGAPL